MNSEIKVLFSEQNQDVIEGCKHFFDGKDVCVSFCPKDGSIVLKKIEELQPQVVFMDVFLSGLDAIAVKQKAMELPNPPKLFFATSSFDNEDTMCQVMQSGFNYYFLKPYSFEIAYIRMKDMLELKANTADPTDLEQRVTVVLHKMGVPAHIKGYGFLRQSIMMSVEDPEVISLVTKRLYPDIAKLNQTTASRVERAIRHAIEVAWDRGNVDVLNDYFGYTINNMRGKPTNSEFIAMISDRLRLENKRINLG
ncbi:MAG: sporulation transcription factor Spo0A [Oscillospiraceae bacterium]